MKDRIRKVLPTILVFVLVFCSLTGCGSKQEKPSDTVLWINATHAVLTESNGWDTSIFGGMEPSKSNQKLEIQMLDEWWGVTDRQSAIDNMDWLINEGHRTDFADFMGMLKDEGAEEFTQDEVAEVLSAMMEDETEGAYLAKAFSDYLAYGEHAIDGWDYSRAMSLLGWYYIAGYYSEQEALDQALELGKTIQSQFSSWDEFMESYFRGYEYWSYESSDARREIYEELKAQKDSPYSVAWDTSLENTWDK